MLYDNTDDKFKTSLIDLCYVVLKSLANAKEKFFRAKKVFESIKVELFSLICCVALLFASILIK